MMMETVKGLIYISTYLLKAMIKNKRFPIEWMKWRVETYYGIPTNEFTFRKLFKIATLSDLCKYARWVEQNRKYLRIESL